MSTWVLLRGLTRESRHWGAFPGILRQLPGAAVVAIDLPGNGRLNAQESPTTVAAMAESCRAQLRQLGVAPPYRLLAMSLGAMVAVAWATAHPGEIAGCVLINTSGRPFSPFHHRLRPGSYRPLLGLLLGGDDIERRERTVWQLTSNQPLHPPTLDEWVAYARQAPVSRRNALRQLLAAARYAAPATPLATPVLILASARDGLVDARCSRLLAARWGVPIAEHAWAGHDLPLDDGCWVARQVEGWLRSPAASAGGEP